MLDSIKISANPYYAPQTPQSSDNAIYKGYLEISGLPKEKGEITIYAVNGEKIRTLIKKEGEYSQLWFLRNEKSELIESGVYLIHIEIKDMEERIMKFLYMDSVKRNPF